MEEATRRAIDQGCLRGALMRLIQLKDAKDAGFKTYVEEEAYRSAKPGAWAAARIASQPFLSRDAKG